MHESGVDEIALSLQESYSLSLLLYAIPALILTKRQLLNVCWNILLYAYYLIITDERLLRSVSTTRVHGPSSRAELTARELGCIF